MRETDDCNITLESLSKQTMSDFEVIQVKDEGNGANWARNKGFKKAKTPYVLFSDNDINWEPTAIRDLYNALNGSRCAYSYGWYSFSNVDVTMKYCNHSFSKEKLEAGNYISTMSMVVRDSFLGFDEKINRFQDWDAWLTLLKAEKIGVYCGKKIFTTEWVDHNYTAESSKRDEKIVKDKYESINCSPSR